jgi:hypothetical protein
MPDLTKRREIVEQGRRDGKSWERIADDVGNITGKGLACWWAAQTRSARRAKNRDALRKPDGPPPGTTKRACLRCNKTFDSEGPHNRMCNPCRYATS